MVMQALSRGPIYQRQPETSSDAELVWALRWCLPHIKNNQQPQVRDVEPCGSDLPAGVASVRCL